jgi:hypothetical protein
MKVWVVLFLRVHILSRLFLTFMSSLMLDFLLNGSQMRTASIKNTFFFYPRPSSVFQWNT